MNRVPFFLYGLLAYAVFFGTFLYSIGFIGDFIVPKTLSSGPVGSLGTALLVNGLLLGVFAVQHSVMARPAFKRWWTRIVPEPIERSTYVLLSSLALILLYWQWRPFGGTVWELEHPLVRTTLLALYGFGWLTVLVSTFLIDHFDLFGLRQVWLHLRGKPNRPKGFVTPGPYRFIRHPLYVGWLIVFWAAPTMNMAHLLFAIATSAYILVAIQLEERDLVDTLGRPYAEYRKRVPMLLPLGRNRAIEPLARVASPTRQG